MSFLVDGTVVGIYKKNDFVEEVNEVTGEPVETVVGAHYLQVIVQKIMDDGSAKAEVVDFKTEEPEIYKPLIGKRHQLSVAFSFWNMNGRSGLAYKVLDSDNKSKFEKTNARSPQTPA